MTRLSALLFVASHYHRLELDAYDKIVTDYEQIRMFECG